MPFTEGFTIANNTNYLGYNGSAITSVASGSALHFALEGGKLVTFYNNTLYYLNASAGTLSLGTVAGSATTWTKNGNVFSYTDGNSRVWYLSYYGGGWHCVPFSSGFTIANNTNYLGYDGSAFTATAAGNALHFSFEDGKVVTCYNDTLYYLTASGGSISLTTSVPSITWVKGADTLSYTDAGSRTWYLQYMNGTWDLFPAATGYTIRSGALYFGVSGSNLTQTNAAGAAVFGVDGSKLFTVIGGTINYLVGSTDGSGTLSFTTTRANGTDWTYTPGGGTMSYSGGGQTWYLYNVDNAWTVYPGANVSLISQSGNYLGAASNTAVGTDASSWTVSGGNIYTFYNGAIRYLVSNGESVALAASPADTWTVSTTVTNGNGWYLVYDGGWKMTPALSYVLITDGNGNYLNRNGTNAVNNGTSAESATRWYADGNKFYAVNGTTKYYLRGTNTALSVTATAANGSEFVYDGTNKRLTFTYNANTYYVVYGNGWTVSQSYRASSTIKASSGNYYLNANTTTVSTGTTAGSATQWYYDPSSGHLYTENAGVPYYLRTVLDTNNKYGSTNMTVTSNENQATVFSFSNNRLTCTLNVNGNDREYSLSLHENTFKMVDTGKTYYTIRSTGNRYLSLNNQTYTASTDVDEAVLWEFSNTSEPNNNGTVTTTVSTLVSGTPRYITLNGSIGLGNSQNLQYYRYNNTYYYLRYSSNYRQYYLRDNGGTWTVRQSRNNNDRITRTAVTFTQATLTFTGTVYTTEEEATVLSGTTTVSPVNALNNLTFTAQTSTTLTFGNVTENVTQTAANVAENVAHTTSAVSENITHTTTAAADRNGLDYETTRRQHIEKVVENNVASGYPTYFPLRVPRSDENDYDAGDILKASQKNTGYVISGGSFYDGNTTGTKVGDIRVSEYSIDNISGSWSTSGLTVSKIRSGNNYLYLEKDEETEEYSIANTTNADLANFWQYENNKLFTTVGKTTYWLTYDSGLKLSETAGVDWTFSNNNRLAYNNNYIKYTGGAWVATANSVNLTLTLGGITDVYTYDGSIHTLTGAQKTDVYNQAVLQLAQTLAGSSNVYGLLFMNSEISEENITVAEEASIFGTTYTDYEFPEDSVDFHVIERGTISFFAGEYFSNNNAFFSLHQVYRYKADDAEVLAGTKKVNDIKHIKQISEIYKHETSGDSVNYVYKFSDNTYSNPDGTYSGANTLADGYSNTPVFRTSWITAPSGLSTSSKRIFFFEIPCNAGEYCLGSVSGRTGAYLIYLDIAANGGEELASAISGTGNDVVTSFQTEFRDAPDTMAHSVMLLSYDAPDGATENTFSVSVNFDKTSAEALEDPHPSGLYTIDVVNKTGVDVTLYVYLCDDDFNLLTAFPYAYKVHYTNTTTGAEGTYLETTFGDTFQMMAGFTIPSSGEAIEVSYH